jgi:hypothetical protein
MSAAGIFWPVTALALWTLVMLTLTAYQRIGAVVRRQLRSRDFKVGESNDVPHELRVRNRNLVNLLEMPVLFYVVCLSLYVTGLSDGGAIWLAWLFVALRVLHSLVHITYNRVTHRLVVFALSSFALLALWIVLIKGLAEKS